jgi:hypothetical protein
MDRRDLDFKDLDALAADVQGLTDNGYERAGKWDLAQTCEHLTTAMVQSMDGFSFQGPWLVRKVIGPIFFKRLTKTRKIKAGINAPLGFVFEPGDDQVSAVDQFQQALTRVKQHQGDFQPHPIFGRLTPEQIRQFHLIHSAHHLSFLIPR